MFDTNIVIVGNVLTAPEWRRTTNTRTLVAHFRVASTSRRFDRDSNRWVDGDSLRVRVNCWRKLAENASASLAVGDPVIVAGRLYTRDWTDTDNNPRISYEMEAAAIGHDLARGKTRLWRNKPSMPVAVVDGADADGVVRGHAAEPVAAEDVPFGYGDGIPSDAEPPTLGVTPSSGLGSPAALAGGGIEPFDTSAGGLSEDDDDVAPDSSAVRASAGTAVSAPDERHGPDGPAHPDESDEPAEIEMAVEALAESPAPRRSRRSAKRQPVPA